jgi:hypothetical protein
MQNGRDAILSTARILPADIDDDGAEERQRAEAELERRLGVVASHAEAPPSDIAVRLLMPVHVCLGQPCEPFVPGIHREAAATLAALEAGSAARGAGSAVALRLAGIYGVGPGGRPEFGYRLFPTTELQLEASGRICALDQEAAATLGIRSVVATAAKR